MNVFDNPALVESNPRYVSELQNLPDHERDRQLWGNWYARASGSSYFQREWLVQVDTWPENAKCCRAWDKAAVEPSESNRKPDYTACSPRMYTHQGLYYIVWDVHPDTKDVNDNEANIQGRFRLRSGERDLKMVRQAHHDGRECHIVLPVDPAAAGKTEFEASAKLFTKEGFVVKKDPMPNNKSKVVRFQPFAAACQNGLVRVVRSSFPNKETYDAYMKELESFDGSPSTSSRKDDWPDATASAFNYISRMRTIGDFTMPVNGSSTLLNNLRKTLG